MNDSIWLASSLDMGGCRRESVGGAVQVVRVQRRSVAAWVTVFVSLVTACGPHVVLPAVPETLANQSDSAGVALARSLAPILHVQRDEPFTLERVVAVINPTRSVIAYHLLWSQRPVGAMGEGQRRRSGLGWIRPQHIVANRPLDVLARRHSPHFMDCEGPTRGFSAVGKTRRSTVRHYRERFAAFTDTQFFLRRRVCIVARHMAWKGEPRRPVGILPQLFQVPGLLPRCAAAIATGCRCHDGRPTSGAGSHFRSQAR